MLYKRALCDVVPITFDQDSHIKMVKTASDQIFVEPGSDKAKIIEAEIQKHPSALFFRSKAIKADEMNSNGDFFSEQELLDSYKSFEGVPFFTNHDNQNVENARGKVVYAEWIPEEKAVYVISFIDREAFPHICRSIEEEYVTGVSMGCKVDYSVCSICGNKAEKTDDYCVHIRNRKGRRFTGSAKDVNTGEVKHFKDAEVYEYNHGIQFVELSAVVDPACPSCKIEGVYANEDYLSKVASLQNTLYMVKTAAIHKSAGQEEINQLNECLATLEELSIKLIQNREQIEMDFASDLVNILSELQNFTDELVGAGYGNVQDQGQVPGTMEAPAEGVPEVAPPAVGDVPPAMEAMEVSENTAAPQAAGTVSGSPAKPLVSAPQMPITAPAKPLAFDETRLKRVASIVADLKAFEEKINEIGEDEMGKRRTSAERIEQKKIASEVLSNSWQEKQDFCEYIYEMPSVQNNNCKLSVKKRDDSFIIVAEDKDEVALDQKVWTYEDLTSKEKELIRTSPKEASAYFLGVFAENLKGNQKEGVGNMTDNIKEAGANSVNKTPEVITQKQLEDASGLYHSRTGEEQDVITQKQLEGNAEYARKNDEPEVITEAQLAEKSNKLNPRQEDEREVITEKQLDGQDGPSPRTGEEWNEVTQAQLDANGNRTGEEADVITEKQLDNVATPWERAASRDASQFKTASEHMGSVVEAMANVVIATGCTPDEAVKVASTMVDSTKSRYELANAILEDSSDEDVDYSKRLAYWGTKNIKVAGLGTHDIASKIVSSLQKVASDVTINPEVVLDAVEVLSEGPSGIESIGKAVDKKLEEAASEESVYVSRKDELRDALRGTLSTAEEREEEREQILASVADETKEGAQGKKVEASKEADTVIETSFDEIGLDKEANRDSSFKKTIASFARGALTSQNIKLAAITNVTINGETISIAVQTDEGVSESVEIPAGAAPVEPEALPEADMAGEGLEGALASEDGKMQKEAQAPMGGGVPGTPGGVAGGPGAPEMGLEGAAPDMQEPVESLTSDEVMDEEVADEIPTAGEKQMPYTICPECGSSDVDVERSSDGNITGGCNNCGAEYEALVKKEIEFKIIKPTKSVGEEGAEVVDEPEVPALPVAAQTKLDKNSIVRVASNKEKFGHVCPACGMNQCKASSEKDEGVQFTCPACGTDVQKNLMVDVNDPENSYLRVQWDLVPDLTACEDCKDKVLKFASMIKLENMMKTAEASIEDFPTANCKELIARTYGGNTTANFGPCKGELLTDCVCKQLERLGLRTVRHMERLAGVYMQDDPMDECIEDQKSKGFEVKEAEHICNCLKKKFASEMDDKPFMQAFIKDVEDGKEKILTAQDLAIVDALLTDDIEDVPEAIEEDVDLADAIVEEDAVAEETVTLEVSQEAAQELADAAAEATVEVEVEEVAEEPEMESATAVEVADEDLESTEINPEEEKDMAMAMQTHKLRRVGEEVVKVASKPKEVEDIEDNVEAGVPRADATIGNEGADNIDVPMAKPDVPRANAEMGNEGPENINPKADLPDVPVDSSYMGDEAQVQSDMPAINNEIKGTVIAEADEKQTKEAKKMKEVDTVEDNVEAGVPRSDATIGNEGADNIDVPMAKPDVPRGDATMGNEEPCNCEGPDVPVDSAYMGQEKEVQSDMPAINDEILKQVQMNREKQLERIAFARQNEAVKVAAKLLATSRITEEAYDDVVEALKGFEIDKIASVADKMYPKVIKQASASSPDVHAGAAIVMESKDITKTASSEESLSDRISSQFTIGNKSFDEGLTRYGEK